MAHIHISLSTYRRKRDFNATPEPQGRVRGSGEKLQFVIQRHEAHRLHFDFRLELDGVLKSWAIPKGPGESVGERRLAVPTEDHPIDYAQFEGDIPPGQYGAGHVDIWDRGTWKPIGDPRQGLHDGHLKFDLAGRRLRGRWVLVRMQPRDGSGKDNWLLIRERDPVPTKSATQSTKKALTASKPEVAGIAISNPDRVVAESDGVTKLDVARYHVDVAKWLLPHVVDRPLAVVKCPGGDLAHCFFQRHPGDPQRPQQRAADTPPYLHLKTIADVVAAVQNGAFEFHSWASRFPSLDRPDRITLDLDPDPALTWPQLREACELTRALLDRLELRWFLKTTGGKGLHFVVPLVARYSWDDVKAFARGLAMELCRTSPKLFTATMSKEKRTGRVFVDYLRNAEAASAVAAYSLRARPGLPVSMPIAWTAMRQDVRGAFFNVRNVPGILARRKSDPWADYERAQQRITAAARKAVRA
ncbi:MAG TPA: non-homologous end-joining DNA ligase [Casimicrobiaceae bacterium]